jgi:hypothetical protein
MSVFDGLRDVDSIPVLWDALGLVLCMVCAVSFTFLMWAVL